jgi:hypothetical protein
MKLLVKTKKSTEMGCFYWVNTVLSNVKTAIEGTSHSFDFGRSISSVTWQKSNIDSIAAVNVPQIAVRWGQDWQAHRRLVAT